MNYKDFAHENLDSFEHIVFMGTYNANPFREKIQEWLPKLDLTSTAFVAADNASSDGTEIWVKKLCSSLGVMNLFLQNATNYGGYGNLISNLEIFPNAKWITTLHQDDFYESNHVQNHIRAIGKSNSNLGMVCSEALSVDLNGDTIPYPRAIWLLEKDLDPVTVFLAHLKQHVFPFSGASISTKVLKRFKIPSHSTAFPDTELVMKMIAEFRVEFAEGVTVRYLENPRSESHSISRQQMEIGSFVALSRVFSHPNFRSICEMVPIDKRPFFYASLQEGLAIRFSEENLRNILTLSVLELVAEHLTMDAFLAASLAKRYLELGDDRAVSQLQIFNPKIKKIKIPRDAAFGQSENSVEVNRGHGSRCLMVCLRILPRRVRKKMFIAIMKTRLGQKLFPSWNLFWNRV